MKTFADNVNQFNKQLNFSGKLPDGVRLLNPFRDNKEILPITEIFYNKFYKDNQKRKLILGINPGRLGAGATGIPFTDTKRLSQICNIKIESVSTYETSSVFVYELIEKYGGVKKFYNDFYINSICPLGFVRLNEKNNWVNCNYYEKDLFPLTKPFIISNMKKQISFGVDTDTCFILGKENGNCFQSINEEERLFKSVIVFDHPRYIEQYKSAMRPKYISEYLSKLTA